MYLNYARQALVEVDNTLDYWTLVIDSYYFVRIIYSFIHGPWFQGCS